MTNHDGVELSIFISYAHADHKAITGIRRQLAIIQRKYNCRVWYDREIKAGEFWPEEIDSHLQQASIAILLISADFYASEYIQDNEFPKLMFRLSQGQVILLALLLGEVATLSDLDNIQFVNPVHRPLNTLEDHEQEHYFCELAKRVKDIIVELRSKVERRPCNNSEKITLVSSNDGESFDEGTQSEDLTWIIKIPPAHAPDIIYIQLHQFVTQTKKYGFIIFARDDYYVQCAFFKELDPSAIVVEVISNAHLLPFNRAPLSRMQIRHLEEDLQFSQPSSKENFMMIAAINSDEDLLALRTIIWHILDDVMNCMPESQTKVSGQCR